jgi:hypothetical protein
MGMDSCIARVQSQDCYSPSTKDWDLRTCGSEFISGPPFFSAADGSLKRQMFLLFQTTRQIIDAWRGVSAFDVLGLNGNLINNEIRARSNAGDSSVIDWGGIGDVVGELVSCLLEWAIDVLL